MQLLICIGILVLSIAVYYMLGRAFCIWCGLHPVWPETACVGFFLYFACFQVVAEGMVFTKQKLHVLGNTWLAVLAALLAAAAAIIYNKRKEGGSASVAAVRGSRPSKAVSMLLALLVVAIVCECASAVLFQRNIGWDFAYYIGNMTTSVETDTMYLYDGSSGLLRDTIELRYALSSFYMNTAWISQKTGVSALVLQKYVVGVLCVLLTNAVAYSFAMEVFGRDRRKAAVLVTSTIVLTVFWDVYDTSAQFLLLRNYEAKAFCANVVLPMVVYLLYRIWKNGSDRRIWIELFLVSAASVPVSMSSVVIVPALTVLMLLAHMLVERQWDAVMIRRAICCLLPNICYLAVYVCSVKGLLVVEV